MNVLNYRILLRKETEGGYTVIVPSLPGCVTYGDTIEEALEMAKGAIQLYLESLKEHDEEILSLKSIVLRFCISLRMNKKQRILIGITFMLLFTGKALTTSYASSDVIISAFDQNPAGSDDANEWVSLETPLTDFVSESHPMAITATGT